MEHIEFIEYCRANEIAGFDSGECSSFRINFMNGEWAEIHAGIDGLYYVCSWIKCDSTQLLKDLHDNFPHHFERMKEKYGQPLSGFAEYLKSLGQ